MTNQIKVLTLHQSWPCLIFSPNARRKNIENRSWQIKPMKNLYIHISANPYCWSDLGSKFFYFGYQHEKLGLIEYPKIEYDHYMSILNSSIVGVVDVIGVFQPAWSTLGQLLHPWQDPKCFGWQLENIRILKNPITGVRGRQKIWNYDADASVTDWVRVG